MLDYRLSMATGAAKPSAAPVLLCSDSAPQPENVASYTHSILKMENVSLPGRTWGEIIEA